MLRTRTLVPNIRFAWFVPLVSLLLAAGSAPADLYEWTDEEGRVQYTNEPRPGVAPVGVAPVALDPEPTNGVEAHATDEKRRDRRKREQADRFLDRYDQNLPTQTIDPVWEPPQGGTAQRPAAPAEDDHGMRERECQARHGMSCLQFETWLRLDGIECEPGAAGEPCRTEAKAAKKKRDKARARRQLDLEDRERLGR